MAAVTVPVTEEGIIIASAAARLLGCHPGGWAEVEVHLLPSPKELQDKALYYIWHRIGDAVYVGDPVRVEGGWSLPLKVRGHGGTFGQLFLSPEGDVIESRSTSAAELEEALRASGPAGSPA